MQANDATATEASWPTAATAARRRPELATGSAARPCRSRSPGSGARPGPGRLSQEVALRHVWGSTDGTVSLGHLERNHGMAVAWPARLRCLAAIPRVQRWTGRWLVSARLPDRGWLATGGNAIKPSRRCPTNGRCQDADADCARTEIATSEHHAFIHEADVAIALRRVGARTYSLERRAFIEHGDAPARAVADAAFNNSG